MLCEEVKGRRGVYIESEREFCLYHVWKGINVGLSSTGHYFLYFKHFTEKRKREKQCGNFIFMISPPGHMQLTQLQTHLLIAVTNNLVILNLYIN